MSEGVVCNHNCDPRAPGARSDGASHFLDCPVWVYLGVTTNPAPTTHNPDAAALGESEAGA